MRSSAACWASFGALCAREYADPALMAVHQISVDAYAVSHPGSAGRREVQSVGIHLMTLQMFCEGGHDPRHGSRLHQRMIGRPAFVRLEPPAAPEWLHASDVLAAATPAQHVELVWAWGRSVWESYADHHELVRSWVAQCGLGGPAET